MRLTSKLLLYACLQLFVICGAHAVDNGQWKGTDEKVRAWFQGLMQPDHTHLMLWIR
jgi:hypothetical protein